MSRSKCIIWPALMAVAAVATPAEVAASEAPVPPVVPGCAQLSGLQIAASQIGISSGSAIVTSATSGTVMTPQGEKRHYCLVLGEIAARTSGASPIRFRVNLPAAWNSRSLQMGGGGFNGLLTDGLGPARDQPASIATPLARGYVTIGTDSGHQLKSADDPEVARFALNDEMFRNFAFEAYKKVADVAAVLIETHYGRAAKYRFFLGGSEGGREALTMAQRYPGNFEGIVSVVPVINWTGLFTTFYNFGAVQRNGLGSINAAKVRLIADHVNATCDALDGIADGVVTNYLACPAKMELRKLRCPDGKDLGDTCLSDGQLATLRTVYEPTPIPVETPNGITSYPPRLFGSEIAPGPDGLARWVSTGTPPTETGSDARGVVYGWNYARFVIARDPSFDVRTYDPKNFETRIKAVADLMDSTNPDLSGFYKRGGKLILRENAGDFAQSPLVGMHYFESVVAKMGKSTVNRFMRFYVSPASAHSGRASSLTTGVAVPTSHDLLEDIDKWVSEGTPPKDMLIQVRESEGPAFKVEAARPMCRYPLYPHYVGGDATAATSYRCRKSGN